MHVHLRIDMFDMGAHRVIRNAEKVLNVASVSSLGQKRGYIGLPFRQVAFFHNCSEGLIGCIRHCAFALGRWARVVFVGVFLDEGRWRGFHVSD